MKTQLNSDNIFNPLSYKMKELRKPCLLRQECQFENEDFYDKIRKKLSSKNAMHFFKALFKHLGLLDPRNRIRKKVMDREYGSHPPQHIKVQ
jgi:hypothetical protein